MIHDPTSAVILMVGPCLRSADAMNDLAKRVAAQGLDLVQAENDEDAEKLLLETKPALIVIDLNIACRTPLVLADLASWRHPDVRILFTASGALFADGAIFAHVPNLCAMLPSGMDDDDMIDVIAFHATPTHMVARARPQTELA
ncbi:MAG: hypothetical protein AAF264_06685 [Pseudomonadota bacterium]